ncbi:hypothetical protein EN829_052575, partial [Mesorhizobium sp. M00.F.Ca.ET.186.01.1.1]
MTANKNSNWWNKTVKAVLATGLTASLAACGQAPEAAKPAQPSQQATTQPAPAKETKQPEQVLRLNNFTEPLSLHPGMITDVWSSNVIF